MDHQILSAIPLPAALMAKFNSSDLYAFLEYMDEYEVSNLTLEEVPLEDDFTLTYRIVATALHVVILILGVFGNSILIAVALSAKSLQTPTYSYLVSLAFADFLVLISAVPEAIVSHHIGRNWILGEFGCSLFIFTNFLGINAGSISILAFTIERYIAIVASPLARKFCTAEKTKKVILASWLVGIVYCFPWFFLTEVKSDESQPDYKVCDFRFTPETYMYFFAADFVLFYVLPLTICIFVYTRIAVVLYQSARLFSDSTRSSMKSNGHGGKPGRQISIDVEESGVCRPLTANGANSLGSSPLRRVMQSRAQTLPMLVITVILFAVTWLPFRALLIYNSLAAKPWLDVWFLLFAKTLIYFNSVVNPFLYNAMSRRFRVAVKRPMVLSGGGQSLQSSEMENLPHVGFLLSHSERHHAREEEQIRNAKLAAVHERRQY